MSHNQLFCVVQKGQKILSGPTHDGYLWLVKLENVSTEYTSTPETLDFCLKGMGHQKTYMYHRLEILTSISVKLKNDISTGLDGKCKQQTHKGTKHC